MNVNMVLALWHDIFDNVRDNENKACEMQYNSIGDIDLMYDICTENSKVSEDSLLYVRGVSCVNNCQ